MPGCIMIITIVHPAVNESIAMVLDKWGHWVAFSLANRIRLACREAKSSVWQAWLVCRTFRDLFLQLWKKPPAAATSGTSARAIETATETFHTGD